MGYLSIGCATVLVFVFLISAGSKLRSRTAFHAFAESLAAMRFASRGRANLLAITLLAAEIGVVPPLLYPGTPGPLRYVAPVALLAVLTTGVLVGMSRRVQVPCHCFGASVSPLGRLHVVRNVLLIAVAVTGGFSASVRDAIQVNGVIIAIAAGGLVATVITRLEDLAMLFGTQSLERPQKG